MKDAPLVKKSIFWDVVDIVLKFRFFFRVRGALLHWTPHFVMRFRPPHHPPGVRPSGPGCFLIESLFFMWLLVFELWSILYLVDFDVFDHIYIFNHTKIDHISKTNSHTKKNSRTKKSVLEHYASFLFIWPLLNEFFWLVTHLEIRVTHW